VPSARPNRSELRGFDEPRGARSGPAGVLRRRPLDCLAGALATACVVMVFVNALALQPARPGSAPFAAPAKPDAAAAAPAQKPDELVSQVQSALAGLGYYDGPVDGLMGARTAGAIRAFQQAQRLDQTGVASEGLLAAALVASPRKAEGAPPAPAARPAAATAPATTDSTEIAAPKLMAVQRALARIGYGPVTIDGKMGAETHNAIRSFERDHKLPETGEPSPQVLRTLQAMTGAQLQ